MPAGRPRKEIDKTNFEKLCGLQCTEIEICYWFDVSVDTLERWCKRTYGAKFADIYALKRSDGLISLRRSQFQLADKNAAMAIWLGKQYLNQKEPGRAEISDEIEDIDAVRADVYASQKDT